MHQLKDSIRRDITGGFDHLVLPLIFVYLIQCVPKDFHACLSVFIQGVPKDTTSEETLRMCLGEIDRCYQDNVMPFFLNLTR